MLFNSYVFIFLFLPVTFLGFKFLIGLGDRHLAIAWLVAASLFFYGWWNPAYLSLILSSILFNYGIGLALSYRQDEKKRKRFRQLILGIGIFGNFFFLGYFKYAGFFAAQISVVLEVPVPFQSVLLPLAISFFTFQQIAYIIDTYRVETRERNFLEYCLFVTFFPQLIAGPIVHHKEMLPQFSQKWLSGWESSSFAVGITIFAIGLFKKVILADGAGAYATPVFAMAEQGVGGLTFLDAWVGALAFSFQLYFDFSGYSDMAIGLARMFGIRLPLNFASPYKATSIVEFWQRWHITLSRFLKDYIYVPLGGNRNGKIPQYINILVTMCLGGLWHGAGWTFVFWGALHGFYIVINHLWRTLSVGIDVKNGLIRWSARRFSMMLTFVAVVIAWVFFRAESFDGAEVMISAMFGGNGFVLPMQAEILGNWGFIEFFGLDEYFSNLAALGGGVNKEIVELVPAFEMIIYLLILVWFAPSTQQFMYGYSPTLISSSHTNHEQRPGLLGWKPNLWWTLVTAMLLFWGISHLTRVQEFIYFQF